jgi:hypothetical protein
MPLRHPAFAAALLVLLLAGCKTTTTPTPPSTPKPEPTVPAMGPVTPPPTPADTRPATLKGSEESSTLLDNFTAFVRTVDGQPVTAGRKGWNQALQLKPGAHRIGVEFVRGSFFARAELTLEAKPAAAYELRQTNDAQVYGQHSFCEFSIVDLATNAKAVPAKRVELEKVKQ